MKIVMIQNAVACDNSGKPKEFQILSSCLSGYIAQKKWRTMQQFGV